MHDRSGAGGAAVGAQGRGLTERGHTAAAALALVGVAVYVVFRLTRASPALVDTPLLVVLVLAGAPLVVALGWRALHGEFGSDHLAGVSIVTAILLHEYLAGAIVVLMLAGGNALEQMAVARATSVLRALAKRVPTVAHRRRGSGFEDVPVEDVRVGDELSLLPYEICPVDGDVILGRGAMDESVPDGRAVHDFQGAGIGGPVGRDQRRVVADHPHDAGSRPTHVSPASCG